MSTRFEVIVIGGGHAGVEAAWAAANLLAVREGERPTVALVTADPAKVGVMSCNPAIGGLAKGQIVREIDALGGVMGLATDATGIQFKVLNTSKGEAVHGPRAQCDKHAYARAIQAMIAARPEIRVIGASVERILVDGSERDGRVRGIEIRRSGDERIQRIEADAVVLTTGTFMRGLMHCGEQRSEGGRYGEHAAVGIAGSLREIGFELGRLKTGTPPRLRRGSIRWDELPPQFGDQPPTAFSDLTEERDQEGERVPWRVGSVRMDRFPLMPQIECRQTNTTGASHEVIRENLHRAPMFSGQIESVGPRYCPSIEDKVVRFAERDAHGVFLEPESLEDDWIYCNGISTSLPADVQDAIVRSMPGCEDAEILRYGYAVEYDMVKPHQILATGMTRQVRGLFLAGQINGTSGYEEAAGQGLVAGVNAARLVRGEAEFVLGREEAYIGVMMDDLVTKTPTEPYRMFTSRAEYRLSLRSDNAAERLTGRANEAGLLASTELGRRRAALARSRHDALAMIDRAIDGIMVDGRPLDHAIRAMELDADEVRRRVEAMVRVVAPAPVWRTVVADRRYRPLLERQRADIRRRAELENKRLPPDMNYRACVALRNEAKGALERYRPTTFGQAARLEGITPADITLLAVLVARTHAGGGEAVGA